MKNWRPRPESNRGARICSPLRSHSATRPYQVAPAVLGQSEGGVPLRQAAELTYRPHAHKLIEHQFEFDTIAIPSQMSGINLVGQFQTGIRPTSSVDTGWRPACRQSRQPSLALLFLCWYERPSRGAPQAPHGDGESSNGRTADSDSACLGSNPSSPAKQNQQLNPVSDSRARGALRTGCSPRQTFAS